MEDWLSWIAIVALFSVGMGLSAFFSGSEIGFYRLSHLRLSIEADSGDRVSMRLLQFVRFPARFVATTLIGNNVANYITTLAIALATISVFRTTPIEGTGFAEIAGTVLFAPIIFLYGELIPKNLFYRAPHRLLRRAVPWFLVFYRLFFVISYPLIGISKLFERLLGADRGTAPLVLGRKRLVQVLSEGHREGLLTEVQSQLVHGLLSTAPQPVTKVMLPAERIAGVREDAQRSDVLSFARSNGQAYIPVRKIHPGRPWFGYLRVADVSLHQRPIEHDIRPFVKVKATASKLEALLALRATGDEIGAVLERGKLLGIVTVQQLIEQLFQRPQTVGT